MKYQGRAIEITTVGIGLVLLGTWLPDPIMCFAGGILGVIGGAIGFYGTFK